MTFKYFLIIMLFLTLNVYAQTKNTPKPSTFSLALQEAKIVIGQLNTELNDAKNSNGNLTISLEETSQKLENSKKETSILQQKIKDITDWGIKQQEDAFKWMEKHDNAIKRYHVLKNIAASVAALFGFILGLNLMRLVPPVYAVYAYALPFIFGFLSFSGIWLFL